MSRANGAEAPARGFLVILTGDFAQTEHPLAKDETLIGRNPTTDITLLDEGISREHALLERDETRVTPGTTLIASSIGRVTSRSITSGEAPG